MSAVFDFDTAGERAHRQVITGLVKSLGTLNDCPDPRVPFTDLHAGDAVRHAGEDWTIYLICHERGWMRLRNAEGRTEHVTDLHPESLWLRGAF